MRQEVVVGRGLCAVSPGDSSVLPGSCGEDSTRTCVFLVVWGGLAVVCGIFPKKGSNPCPLHG